MYTPGSGSQTRAQCETVLSTWLRANGISHYALAKTVSAHQTLLRSWANGQVMPNLVFAFRIERATKGAVPVSSWLGSELGRHLWENAGTDWTGFDRAREGWRSKRNAALKVEAKAAGTTVVALKEKRRAQKKARRARV